MLRLNLWNVKIAREWEDQFGQRFIRVEANFLENNKEKKITFCKLSLNDLFLTCATTVERGLVEKEMEITIKAIAHNKEVLFEIEPVYQEPKEMTVEEIESILDYKIKIVSK